MFGVERGHSGSMRPLLPRLGIASLDPEIPGSRSFFQSRNPWIIPL